MSKAESTGKTENEQVEKRGQTKQGGCPGNHAQEVFEGGENDLLLGQMPLLVQVI